MDIKSRVNSGETRIIVDTAEEEDLHESGICVGKINFGETESRLAIRVDDTVSLPSVRLEGEGGLSILVPRGDGVRLPYFLPEEWQDDITTSTGEHINNIPLVIAGLGRLAVHNFETSQLMDDLTTERENLTDSGRGFLIEFKRRVVLVNKITAVEAAIGITSNILTAEQDIKVKFLRIAQDEYGIDADTAGKIFDTILNSSIPHRRKEKRGSYPWSTTAKRALERELRNDYRSLTNTWDSFLISLSRRYELVSVVGEIKRQLGMKVHQPGRQQELKNELMDTADLIGVSRSVAARLYDIMHSGSTDLQSQQRHKYER